MPERLTDTEIVELAQDRKRWDSIQLFFELKLLKN
jgi:hypothetical protein